MPRKRKRDWPEPAITGVQLTWLDERASGVNAALEEEAPEYRQALLALGRANRNLEKAWRDLPDEVRDRLRTFLQEGYPPYPLDAPLPLRVMAARAEALVFGEENPFWPRGQGSFEHAAVN